MPTNEDLQAELSGLYTARTELLSGRLAYRLSHGSSSGTNRFTEFRATDLGTINARIATLEGQLGIGKGRPRARRIMFG